MITIPIEIGDVILTGKFRNHKVTVKEIGIDDYGLPTVNGKSIMKIRIENPMPTKEENIMYKSNPKRENRVVESTNSSITISFLDSLDPKVKEEILTNIAKHYGISNQQAYEEVTDEEAESIMDYITGSIRSTVSLLFNKFKANMRESRLKEAPAQNNPKVQKVVDEINKLIASAVDADGDPLEVTDSSSSWESPMIYQPIIYENGQLKITYTEPLENNKPNVEVIKKANMEFDGIPTLKAILSMYKKAIKQSGKPTSESISKLTRTEQFAIKKVLRKRISEGIDNRSIDIKIKKEDGTFWFYLQLDDDKEECISNTGFETMELARHAALMKGFTIVGDKDNSLTKLPDTVEVPKPTKREKTPDTEKPKEIDLGKEKTIKLEETFKKLIRKEIKNFRLIRENAEKYIKYIEMADMYGWGNVFEVLVKAGFDTVSMKKSGVPTQGSDTLDLKRKIPTMNPNVKAQKVYVDEDGGIVVKTNVAYMKFWDNNMKENRQNGKFTSKAKSRQKKKNIAEAATIDDKVKDALMELKDLQKQLADAQAQIEAIKKKTNFDAIQKQADKLLKEELWDFFEELKNDEKRIVEIENIVLKINRHQAAPATYNYEKVIDFVMTQVNQDVKNKILLELKAVEKIGKTKANVSFTEGIGDVWDSIKSMFSKIMPILKKKGREIDADIQQLKRQIK